ncbi:MAG: RDD family protein [Archangium sp.]|nr:RDD family protein [Archangium sp.]
MLFWRLFWKWVNDADKPERPRPEGIRLDPTHTVVTPEYVEFNFVVAGLLSRLLALIIDTVVANLISSILLILVMLVAALLATVIGTQGLELGLAVYFVISFLVQYGYMLLLEAVWSGQTVGKRVMGLRVVQDTGVRVTMHHSLLRNLIRLFDNLPIFYLVGGVVALFSENHQRLGDILAGTIVVRERRLKIPAQLERPDGDVTLLSDADFRARVAKLSAEEETLLFSAAIRREELGMEARLNLFATLARRLEDDLGFTKPPHLSDEKLVLLVSAALAARNAQKRKAARPKRFLQR